MIPFEQYQKAADYLAERIPEGMPRIAVVLGSGLGALAKDLRQVIEIPYRDIPGFPRPTVASHAGVLYVGILGETRVALLCGRSHYYEGHSFEQICFAVRVLHLCGVSTLILTNAAGGVNLSYQAGDLMIITDHIKFIADSPCRGQIPAPFGETFPDMSEVYTIQLRDIAARVIQQQGLAVHQGVYFYMSGPQFETPAEIRAVRALGGDAVGMSTVPEAIAACACGMKVLGISCITNLAAGMVPDRPVTDAEVVETAARVGADFRAVISRIVQQL